MIVYFLLSDANNLGRCSNMYSRNYSITSVQRQNYVMSRLGFSIDHFDYAVVTVQGVLQETSGIPILRTLWKTA